MLPPSHATNSTKVLLAGPFNSVIRAFEMVSEILNGGNSVDNFVLCLNMLLEHSKVLFGYDAVGYDAVGYGAVGWLLGRENW